MQSKHCILFGRILFTYVSSFLIGCDIYIYHHCCCCYFSVENFWIKLYDAEQKRKRWDPFIFVETQLPIAIYLIWLLPNFIFRYNKLICILCILCLFVIMTISHSRFVLLTFLHFNGMKHFFLLWCNFILQKIIKNEQQNQ